MTSAEIVIASFLAITLAASIVSRKTRTPYTVLLVIIGIVLAATSDPGLSSVALVFANLREGGLFVGLILPPLLFESMFSIRTEDFRAVSRPAFILATGGVLLATLVVGVILWNFAGLQPFPAFLFAALIAPTDVATVLEIFRRTAVPSRLATLMETESVFNDATGITILTIFLAGFDVYSSRLVLLSAIGQGILIFGGGVLVGGAVAWGARQLQREAQDRTTQIILTLTAAYGSYGLASALGVSGLIAVAVTGLLYGNTVLFRIAMKDIEVATREFWGVLAFVANTVAFLFVGLSTNILSLGGSFGAILVAYVVVVASRVFSVYPILSFPGISSIPIPWSWRNVAMIGGMRGALSIALVASLPTTLPGYSTVVNMTFGVAVISILVQGPLLANYAKRAFGEQQTLAQASLTVSTPP